MNFKKINEKTGFAKGEKFETEGQVRKYFTVDAMDTMFGDHHNLTQSELDKMADLVIKNRWHMVSKNE
jgi:hypothetical protein